MIGLDSTSELILITEPSVLHIVFGALSAGAVLAYVLLDGFDLGVGILCPLVARKADTDTLFDSIAPFWDASEIWLVFGGLMLLVGFPRAFAAILPHLSSPLCLMLVSLVLRGVSYKFQFQGRMWRRLWQLVFAFGSVAVGLCQGWMVGLILEGIEPPANQSFIATVGRDVFPFVCGVGMLAGYALLGCCWLIVKTEGALQVFGREVGFSALILTGAMLAVVSVWTPLISAHVAPRWLTPAHLAVLSVLPAMAAFAGSRLWKSLWGLWGGAPLLWAILLLLVAFATFAAGIYPLIVPYGYTLTEAANDSISLEWAGVGVAIVLPFTILYQSLAHRVFRGKVLRSGAQALPGVPHIGSRRTSSQPVDLHMS
jgi:cytochrome bd ubiquinol oxidase subunit II